MHSYICVPYEKFSVCYYPSETHHKKVGGKRLTVLRLVTRELDTSSMRVCSRDAGLPLASQKDSFHRQG